MKGGRRGWRGQRLGRRFGWLWGAYGTSALGTWLAFGAFPLIAVRVLHAGPAEVAALSSVGAAVGAAAAIPLGPWVEARRKRPVLIGADLVRCAALLTIPAAFALGALTFLQLLAVSVVVAAADITFRAASGAYLKTLVPAEHLLVANARFESTAWTTTIVGPPLGGAAIGLLGPVVTVVADAVSYLLSAVGICTAGVRAAGIRTTEDRALGVRAAGGRWSGAPRVRWRGMRWSGVRRPVSPPGLRDEEPSARREEPPLSGVPHHQVPGPPLSGPPHRREEPSSVVPHHQVPGPPLPEPPHRRNEPPSGAPHRRNEPLSGPPHRRDEPPSGVPHHPASGLPPHPASRPSPPSGHPKAAGPRLRPGDLLDGWRYILGDPGLRPLFLNTAAFNGLLMATEPLLTVLLLGRYGFAPWQYGLAFAAPSVGGLLGSRLARPLVSRYGQRRVLVASGALRALWPVGLAFVGPGTGGLLLVIGVEFGLILCCGVFNPVCATYRLERTATGRAARTLTAWAVTTRASIALLTAVWGVLGTLLGPRPAIALAGVLILATPLLLPRHDRTTPRREPEPAGAAAT